jgi:glucose/arabinose dehydrogenase
MLGHSRKLCATLAVCLTLAACACSKAKDGTPAAPPAPAAPAAPAAPTASAPAAAAPEGKQRVEGQGFVVEVKTPASPPAPGSEGAAQVVLNATGPYHLNKDFPTVLEVTAPDGVTLGKVKMTAADASKFEEKVATWDVKFTAKDAGDKKFGAKFRFAVCTETTCDPKKEALAWTVPVK